jgi:hypothetical protein
VRIARIGNPSGYSGIGEAAELTVKFTQPDASPSWEKEYEPAGCPGNESVNDPGDGSNTFVMLLTTEQPDPAYREPNPPVVAVPLMVKG